MDSVEVIEQRISALEEKVFGRSKLSTEPAPELSAELLNVNSKIISALAHRDSINSVLNRLDQLEGFMDPMYVTKSGLTPETKLELVKSAEDEMREILANFEQVNKLAPALDSDYIKKVPDMTAELEKQTLVYLDFKEKADKQTGDVQDLLKKYNEIVTLISASFVKWDEVITNYEIDAAEKKIID
ncbi:dynactin subunit 3-like [Neocloeon triangulifer]|uniref:dynactin subunit 3-like n=1 Tax=Neocloeon triangulifer TaxID=2078957 RepID=UPI00286F93A5|nr:dynactin subunit 3-like [Neocloeon triangulifer]